VAFGKGKYEKSSRSLQHVPLIRLFPLLCSVMTEGNRSVVRTKRPLLTPMTSGPEPTSHRRGRWRRGGKRWNLNRRYSMTRADKTEAEPSGALKAAVGGPSEIVPRGEVHLCPSEVRAAGLSLPLHCGSYLHKDMAPPAGSYLTRGGPGGYCRYPRTGVPPLAVSRQGSCSYP